MADRILVVEGDEDAKFFCALVRHLDLKQVEVKCHPAGKGNAIKTFCSVLTKQTKSSRAQIGLVVDADFASNGGGHQASVHDINSKAQCVGFNPLNALAGGGYQLRSTVCSQAKAGVWVMPDCSNDGLTEHFLEKSISSTEVPRFEYAGSVFKNAISQGPALGLPVKEHHHAKARLGTWLAWQDPPRMSFANALYKSLFDMKSTQMHRLICWLNWLFA